MAKQDKLKEGIYALGMVISGFISLLFMFLQESVYDIYAIIIGIISLMGYIWHIYHIKKYEILRSGWY